jgi:TolB-like protein
VAAQKDDQQPRQRIAIQKFVTYPDVSTSNAVASVAADYLAAQLSMLNRFDVVAPSDLNLMARYLGENWALLCSDNDRCRQRLATMAEAQYVLSGELRSDPANYHLSLVLLDEAHGRAVWRMQESVAPDLQKVKAVLDEATRALNVAVIP